MIRRLHIRDLALMDRAELELGSGFTVVTGETGAGKSVLLGALSLLAGNRAAKTIVRKGAEECSVEAELETDGDKRFDEVLKSLDLPLCDDGLLILKRSVHATKDVSPSTGARPRSRSSSSSASYGSISMARANRRS
jgi:DNA repair protein RecN (Recombination protein N)